MVPRIFSVHVKNLSVAVPICKIAVRNYTPSLISALDPLGHHAVICKCVCVCVWVLLLIITSLEVCRLSRVVMPT